MHTKAYIRGEEIVTSALERQACKTVSSNVLVRFAAGPNGTRTNVLLAHVLAYIRIVLSAPDVGPSAASVGVASASGANAASTGTEHRLAMIKCYRLSNNKNCDSANKVVWKALPGGAGRYVTATKGKFYWTGAVDLRSIETKVAMGRVGNELSFYPYNKMSGVQGRT